MREGSTISSKKRTFEFSHEYCTCNLCIHEKIQSKYYTVKNGRWQERNIVMFLII
jgi:hypothetical protein